MAKVDKHEPDTAEETTERPKSNTEARRSRKPAASDSGATNGKRTGSVWIRRFKFLLILVAIIGVLPSVLGITGVVHPVLGWLAPEMAATVEWDFVTLHWWAPVEFKGVKVRDRSRFAVDPDSETAASMNELATIDHVFTEQPLWRIALDRGRNATLHLQHPVVRLIADEQGNNVQETLEKLVDPTSDSSDPFPATAVIVDGRIEFCAVATQISGDGVAGTAEAAEGQSNRSSALIPGQNTVLDNIECRISTAAIASGTALLPEVQLTARVSRADESLSRESVAGIRGNASQPYRTSPRIAADLDSLASDLSRLQLNENSTAGSLSGVTGSGGPLTIPMDGRDLSNGNNLLDSSSPPRGSTTAPSPNGASSGPATVADDFMPAIDIQIGRAEGKAGGQQIRLKTDQLDLRMLTPFLGALLDGIQCDGRLSCDVTAQLSGRTVKDGLMARIKADGTDVRVRHRDWASGEWIRFGSVEAVGAGAFAQDGMLLNDVRVTSEIMEVRAQGELRSSHSRTASGSGSEAGDTLPPQPIVMIRGSIDAALVARMIPATLRLRNDVQIREARIAFGLQGDRTESAADESSRSNDLNIAAEPSVNDENSARWRGYISSERIHAVSSGQSVAWESPVRLDAAGSLKNGQPQIEQAQASADFGTLQIQPSGDGYLVQGNVRPNLLWQHLSQFVDVPQPGIRGDVTLAGHFQATDNRLRVSELQVQSSDLTMQSRQLLIDPSRSLTSMLDGAISIEATGASIRTLLAPLADVSWLSAQSRVTGSVSGVPGQELQLQVQVVPVHGIGRPLSPVSFQPIISSVTTASPTAPFEIDEAVVELAVVGAVSGEWQVRSGTVRLPGLAAIVSGTVTPVAGTTSLNLTAVTSYDLSTLCSRLLGPTAEIQLSGTGQDTFTIRGTPSLTGIGAVMGGPAEFARAGTDTGPLHVTGRIAWQAGTLYGMAMGPGAVQGELDQGVLRTEPVQFAIGGGQAHLMARYDVSREILELASGSRVEGMQLTPELCRQWLGYVSPLISESADVNGALSARVDRFVWNLATPELSDANGVLTIHSAEATPGSSLLQMLETVDTIRRVSNPGRSSVVRSLVMPPQNVDVEVRQGYVIHRGLKVELAGYQAQSSGAVGLNQQLQITLTIPLEKGVAGAQGQTIQIPLHGSIDSPRADTSGLLQGLGQRRIEQEVNNQLDRQLNKLFDRF